LTNIKLNKIQAYLLALRGQNGLARAITPASTSYDGDVIFCLSQGNVELDTDLAFEMGSEAIRMSIIESARQAQSLGGLLSATDRYKKKQRRGDS
jgi:L-aminopeptidase/D-esterase-like protein